MFTGLIEDVGKVVKISRTGSSARLDVTTTFPLGEIGMGDSIAVNGICLTVVEKGSSRITFDVSPETIDRSAFRQLKPGDHVNLERALRLGDRLGGHIVSGHVDCTASILSRREISGNYVFEFRLPRKFARYVIEKGSVAIDGISLTVNTVSEEGFSVNIIPHTEQRTNLRYRKPGDEVNIETDIIGKYVERLFPLAGRSALQASSANAAPAAAAGREGPSGEGGPEGGVTMELLAKGGFL